MIGQQLTVVRARRVCRAIALSRIKVPGAVSRRGSQNIDGLKQAVDSRGGDAGIIPKYFVIGRRRGRAIDRPFLLPTCRHGSDILAPCGKIDAAVEREHILSAHQGNGAVFVAEAALFAKSPASLYRILLFAQ